MCETVRSPQVGNAGSRMPGRECRARKVSFEAGIPRRSYQLHVHQSGSHHYYWQHNTRLWVPAGFQASRNRLPSFPLHSFSTPHTHSHSPSLLSLRISIRAIQYALLHLLCHCRLCCRRNGCRLAYRARREARLQLQRRAVSLPTALRAESPFDA